MISALTLNDRSGSPVTFHDPAGSPQVTSVTGLTGIPSLRANVTVAPTRHGSVDNTRWTDGAVVVVEGFVNSSSWDTTLATFRALTAPMLQTLDDGPALLKWTEDTSGLQLQKTVRLAADVSPVFQPGPRIVQYQAQFLAADPRSYTQSLTTATGSTFASVGGATMARTIPVTFIASDTASASVNNTGNRPTPAVFRVYGYATNPQIVLVGDTANRRIAMTGTLGAGDYLELDVQARTVTLNGVSPAQEFIDASGTSWFDLPVGTSTIRLLVGSNDAVTRVDVLYRPAYT